MWRRLRPRRRSVRRTRRTAARDAAWARNPPVIQTSAHSRENWAPVFVTKRKTTPITRDREPGDEQAAQLLGEADAALRLVEPEGREHDEGDERDGEQRRHVARLEVPTLEFCVIGDDADADDEQRIGELQRRFQERRVFLEQVAAHGDAWRGYAAAAAARARAATA